MRVLRGGRCQRKGAEGEQGQGLCGVLMDSWQLGRRDALPPQASSLVTAWTFPNCRTGGLAPETQAQVRAILEGLAVASKYPARR